MLFTWLQDDETVLQKLEAALAAGPDPELDALTKVRPAWWQGPQLDMGMKHFVLVLKCVSSATLYCTIKAGIALRHMTIKIHM
jgi:hypothetical protein